MEFKSSKSGKKRVLFDAHGKDSAVAEKCVAPTAEQDPNESRRLWQKLTDAILASDMEAATEAKTAVEDAQRETRRKREESNEKHIPRYFDLQDGRWIPKISDLPDDPNQAVEVVQRFIWP